VLRELALIWHDYRSRAWRTPLIQRISSHKLTQEDYLRWMECWIPQVREGSLWMRRAVANMGPQFQRLRELIEEHAGDEQLDFRILFEDYQAAGGTARTIKALKRNSGGEALNAYMYARAADSDAVDLLGAIYIIEGTGQRIIPALLPLVKTQLDLPPRVYRFLDYHGQNDTRHLARWLEALAFVLDRDNGDALGEKVIATARNTAQLYVMQMGAVL
jgi:3-oxoacyl-[acyl-carrier-protein] synthase-3